MNTRSQRTSPEEIVVECPVCLRDVRFSEGVREGDIVQCPFCKEWFKLVKVNGKLTGERV
jgi:endogenous inhibitor of DNA gyrase (YacG/DUF329 family)